MKKVFIFLALLSLGISVSKAQVYDLYPQDSPLKVSEFQGHQLKVDAYPILKSVGGYDSYNYQDLPSTLLSGIPIFLNPGILVHSMKWDCDPGILLSSKYINLDPKMLIPFDENKYEKEIHFDEPLHPNSFFSPYLLPGTNPFMNKLELLPPVKLHIPDFRLFDLMTK